MIVGHFSKWDTRVVTETNLEWQTDIHNDIRISLLASITTNKMRMKPWKEREREREAINPPMSDVEVMRPLLTVFGVCS